MTIAVALTRLPAAAPREVCCCCQRHFPSQRPIAGAADAQFRCDAKELSLQEDVESCRESPSVSPHHSRELPKAGRNLPPLSLRGRESSSFLYPYFVRFELNSIRELVDLQPPALPASFFTRGNG